MATFLLCKDFDEDPNEVKIIVFLNSDSRTRTKSTKMNYSIIHGMALTSVNSVARLVGRKGISTDI